MTTADSSPQPHRVAYAMLGTGLAFSLAANVTHGVVSGAGVGAVISGLVWPLSLVLAIEGAVRLPWPRGGWWMALRIGGALPVAATAAIVSYLHMSGLLTHWKEHWLTCLIGPVAVDGLTTLGAAALLILDRPTAIESPTQSAVEPLTEPAHETGGPTQWLPWCDDESTHEATQPPTHDRPTGPTQSASPQVTAPAVTQAPVSQEAIDRVLGAVMSGQPMGKAAIMAATGLSRSTAGRALTHLVAVGRLSTIGKSTQPDYIMASGSAQGATREASSGSAHEVAGASR